jgi:hypothetical protein
VALARQWRGERRKFRLFCTLTVVFRAFKRIARTELKKVAQLSRDISRPRARKNISL